MKKPLSIEEQILHLKNDKKIIISNLDEKILKQDLLLNNYINTITPLKVYFATNVYDSEGKALNYKHTYNETNAIEWLSKRNFPESNFITSIYLGKILELEKIMSNMSSYFLLLEYSNNTDNYCNHGFIEFLKQKNTKISSGNKKDINKYNKFFEKLEKSLKYSNNIYVALDRLSITNVYNLFCLLGKDEANDVIEKINERNVFNESVSINYLKKNMSYIIGMRNCFCHNNDLEIYFQFQYGKRKDRSKFENDKKNCLKILNKFENFCR